MATRRLRTARNPSELHTLGELQRALADPCYYSGTASLPAGLKSLSSIKPCGSRAMGTSTSRDASGGWSSEQSLKGQHEKGDTLSGRPSALYEVTPHSRLYQHQISDPRLTDVSVVTSGISLTAFQETLFQ